MDPSLLVVLLNFLLQHGPEAANAVYGLLKKQDLPTQSEWDALLALVSKPGEAYFTKSVPGVGGA